jgi:hypothetical protein
VRRNRTHWNSTRRPLPPGALRRRIVLQYNREKKATRIHAGWKRERRLSSSRKAAQRKGRGRRTCHPCCSMRIPRRHGAGRPSTRGLERQTVALPAEEFQLLPLRGETEGACRSTALRSSLRTAGWRRSALTTDVEEERRRKKKQKEGAAEEHNEDDDEDDLEKRV